MKPYSHVLQIPIFYLDVCVHQLLKLCKVEKIDIAICCGNISAAETYIKTAVSAKHSTQVHLYNYRTRISEHLKLKKL